MSKKTKQALNLKNQTLEFKKGIHKKNTAFSHDKFFKLFYSNPDLATELFELIFSKKEMKAYDWKKLKIEKDSFEDKRADLIFSVPFKKIPKMKLTLFILLEHKSYYDKNLFHQLLDYQVLIHRHNKDHLGYLQPIIPVLFYHGRQNMKWKSSFLEENFRDSLFKIPLETRKNMLNYKLKVIDVNAPRVQRAGKDKRFKGRGALSLLREIWSLKNPTDSKLREIVLDFKELFKSIEGQRKEDVLLGITEYLKQNTGLSAKNWKKIEDLMVKEGFLKRGGTMINMRKIIRERALEEGFQKGQDKGQQKFQKVILNMLKKKLDISLIAEVTGLSKAEIKKLKNSHK